MYYAEISELTLPTGTVLFVRQKSIASPALTREAVLCVDTIMLAVVSRVVRVTLVDSCTTKLL